MIRLAGVRPSSSEYIHGIELFPRSSNNYSQVRGPLGVNRKPEANGARSLFEGAEPNLVSQLEWLASRTLNRTEDALREVVKRAVHIKSKTHSRPLPQTTNILDLVDWRVSGGSFVAQCPLCAAEGHDRHRDNLRISSDGRKFCCVFGGPGKIHKAKAILKAIFTSL